MSGIQNYKSHFSQLLATFHVSGTELADILHIDASLVSKWKNNKRSLKSNSPFMDSITDYFISLDTISGYATLRELLSTEHINFDSLSEEQLKITFKRWLLSAVDNSENDFSLQDLESQCKKGKAYSYLQFQGNAGKRDAVLGLLRHAASLPPPGQELILLLEGSQHWLIEDDTYSDVWEAANLAFLNAGNHIRVIHTIDYHYDMLAKVMITWIPLYLTGKALPFFVSPHTQSGSINQGLLLLKDKMLLQSMSPADESFESTTLATNNEHLLSESYRLLQKSMRYAIPLFSFYYRAEHSKYGIFLSQMVKLDDDQYLFMRFPFVNIIPSIQIQGILTDNSINGETRNKAMQTCRALKTDVRRDSGHHFRYLIPQSQLAELLSQEYIMLDVVSFIVGQPLYISNKVFRDLLKKMVTMLSQDSHQIIREVVLLEDVHVKQLKNLNMLVKKNTCLSIFNSPEHYASGNEPLVMTTTESTFVHSSYLFCEQLWNNTLPQTREHTYVARQLEILMETVPVPTSQQES